MYSNLINKMCHSKMTEFNDSKCCRNYVIQNDIKDNQRNLRNES